MDYAGRVQGGYQRPDFAHSALVAAGIAVALGGAALFGVVAHTKTPFFERMGTAPPDGPSLAASFGSPKPGAPSLPRGWPKRPAELQIAEAVPAIPPAEALPPPKSAATRMLDSLSLGESLVAESRPAAPPPAETSLTITPAPDSGIQSQAPSGGQLDSRLRRNDGQISAEAVPVETKTVQPPQVETKVETKVAETKTAETWIADTRAAELKVIRPKLPEAAPLPAKPVDPVRVEAKVAKAKPVVPKPIEPRPVVTKVVQASRVEPKPVAAKVASKVAEAKRPEPKPVAVKLPEAKRVAARPVALRTIGTKPIEPKRAEAKRSDFKLVVAKPVEPRRAETKRVAEVKADANAKLAEAKRAAELKATEWKLAETKHAAEAAEAKLAETKRAAEMMAAEAKLAETQRAVEMRAAEAKLAQTRQSVETTLAEAKLAREKLAEMKHAVEMTSSVRPASPRYSLCETCGIVTAVSTRAVDRGSNRVEVRVKFGTGSNWTFLYPTDPGFSIGDQVRAQAGRLTRM